MSSIKVFAFADEASKNFDEQIIAMNRNNLSGIEIRNVDDENISDISIEKAKEIKLKLDDNNLSTWSIGSPIGKIDIEKDDFAKHLDKLKHTLEIANVLDTKNIRIFSFYIPDGKNADIYKNEVIDRLSEMCEIAKDYNIKLCHENEKGIYGDVPERCIELFNAIPDLKGIFDPANFVQCNVDTLKAYEMLKNHIHYMHIKDAEYGGNIVLAGKGDGNIPEIAKRYINNGGFAFTLEPHLFEFSGLKNLERENEKSAIAINQYSDANTAFDDACNAFKALL